jgi:hypothetical protein
VAGDSASDYQFFAVAPPRQGVTFPVTPFCSPGARPALLRVNFLGGKAIMTRRCLSYLLATACATAILCGPARAQTRAVVELFTSQGCSSCPPADALLGDLAHDPSLVAISLPIDYWDYLGWKDTLAEPRHTARQKAYAHARGDGQVYTPQVVVNGSVHVLGSDKAAIEHAIVKTRKNGAMAVDPVTLSVADGRIELALPHADTAASAEAWLCGLMKTATIAIGRGENKGRTITYHNVARRWIRLGEWTGQYKTWSVAKEALAGDGINEAAVLLQSGTADKPRTILAAAFAPLLD